MSKGTPLKEAIAKWEEKKGIKAAEAISIKLYGQNPPIEKMDNSLNQLIKCEKLSLSSNNIEKIGFLANLKNLKVTIIIKFI